MTRELLFRVTLTDCDVQAFRAGGNGGQHRDKTSNAIRIVHRASGATGQCSEDRSQHKNKRTAFRRMAESPKFEQWRKTEAARLMGRFPKSLDDLVDEQMAEENLIVEVGR